MGAERPLSKINFFICSTFVDLRAYRDAVRKKIERHAGVINAQEFFGARDQKPLDTCLEEVEKSQVFVMFLGPRFGSVDPASGKSFVECEYQRAKETGLPRVAYIIDEAHPFPIKEVSTGEEAEKLRRFTVLYGVELPLTGKFGDSERADESECEAFSCVYGAALKRDLSRQKRVSTRYFMAGCSSSSARTTKLWSSSVFLFLLRCL